MLLFMPVFYNWTVFGIAMNHHYRAFAPDVATSTST